MKRIVSFLLRNVPRKYLQLVNEPMLKIAGFFLKGDNVTCPIINKSYRKFLPYGRLKPRENALCPDSLSLERHRLLWLYLKDRSDFFDKPKKFLHIAPEQCFMEKFEKVHGEGYITADLESPLAKVKMDIHEIPFPDNSFDVCMCNHVMEHVADDLQAMREIYRVLKPGGWAIMQVPFFSPIPDHTLEDPGVTDPREREEKFGQDDHVRLYGKDYPERLRTAGFTVKEEHYAEELGPEKIRKFALPPTEIIYLASKV